MKYKRYLIAAILILSPLSCNSTGTPDEQSSLTPSQVLADPSSHVGQTLTVVGTATTGTMTTTLMLCPEDNPCCNASMGTCALIDQGAEDTAYELNLRPAAGSTDEYICQSVAGECGYTCTPLTYGSDYSVTGTLRQSAGDEYLSDGTYYLSVESYAAQ